MRRTWLAKSRKALEQDWLWAWELGAEFPAYSREHQWAVKWDLLCLRCTQDTFVCFCSFIWTHRGNRRVVDKESLSGTCWKGHKVSSCIVLLSFLSLLCIDNSSRRTVAYLSLDLAVGQKWHMSNCNMTSAQILIQCDSRSSKNTSSPPAMNSSPKLLIKYYNLSACVCDSVCIQCVREWGCMDSRALYCMYLNWVSWKDA